MLSTSAPLNRRRLLRLGTLGLAGLNLPQVLWADDQPRPRGARAAADACILVFLNGGPSHLDMWDPKPEAPADIRGEFNAIDTSLPGVQFSEHLPRMAKYMHRGAVIRSANHRIGHAHGAAVYTMATGHDRGDTVNITPTLPTDHPSIAAAMCRVRPPERVTIPSVLLPYATTEGIGGPPQAGFFGGLLGRSYDPLVIRKDPNSPDFSVPEFTLQNEVSSDRLSRRASLESAINASFGGLSAQASDAVDHYRARAFDLLTSTAAQRAFRLTQEPDRVRDAYGRNIYGQSVLLARRLIEAGTRVVTVAWAPDANATWDTHWDHVNRLKNELLPPLDGAIGSLLDDLVERGLFERTLVVVMGEFGRTPKISAVNEPSMPITKIPGRSHWPFCYSLWMAGGPIKRGFVHGASDKIGAFPAEKPVSPAEIIATIYHALGVPTTFEFRDALDRPYSLVPWGQPIIELLA